eukprot:gnl/TRDRNA2_/TRDRNA2_184975_c0_seq1.p1 gnl/TRDRNA2_/TRDRNA2_184975_c0~~gnl/TRDRNA2_/TRDRNA2_184975_c0_seq1.p1  ORF type:complete len:567 (+),score=163.83 gnl/TRDRNA2_/TRDRNA2_184975_c0_seq1:126-1703(+)
MADAEEPPAAPAAEEGTATEGADVDRGPPAPSPAEHVAEAELRKEEGNALLKGGDFAMAVAKYKEGIDKLEPLLEKDPTEIGEELQQRCTAVYVALRLNSAQACLKLSDLAPVIEHTGRVLLLDKDNTKALYRRALACVQLDTEGRLEQATSDFRRVAELEPTNREARTQLSSAKERLKELKQIAKERLAAAMTGGLYQEQHAQQEKLQAAYQEEVDRRKAAGEGEITLEDFAKKEKEKADEAKKKAKEEIQQQQTEAKLQEELRLLGEENDQRKADGLEEYTLEQWREVQRAASAGQKKAEVVKTDDLDLDEEEKKLLQETSSKGYYHGRLGTVLSSDAPIPQQVAADAVDSVADTGKRKSISEWNQAGTWEEKDMTAWVKDRLSVWLQNATVSSNNVGLPSGKVVEVRASVTKVKSITGEGALVTVRNTARHGFNFEADVSFSLSFAGFDDGEATKTFSGSFNLPELNDATQPADMTINAKWKSSSTPPDELGSVATEWVAKLKDSLRAQVSAFNEEYKQKTC